MTRYADLHVHTFFSDSTFSPEEVVACAKGKGLAAIAICDHDSIDGIAPCEEAASGVDLEIIPSIELTVEKDDTEIHVLGYFINWKTKRFQEKLREIQAFRVERVHRMTDKLKAFNIGLEPEEVFGMAGKGSISRLHVAQALLKGGHVRNLREAFDKYIGLSKPCYVSNMRFSPKEAIETLLAIGGVPVLAHPDVLGRDEYIEELMGYGLKGIEAYHTDHKPAATRHYRVLAERHGLIVTGGSDCHGLGKGRVLMGSVKVPYEVVEKLRAASGGMAR
jgi:predicted metal-dependent phosphoesterase TrpH